MKGSKYKRPLQQLSKKPVFTAQEGKRAGIPSRMLAYFCSTGKIERISRGIYKVKHIEIGKDFEWEDLLLAAMSIPKGIVCLISALCYYGLTDEIMREFWIAIPHSTTSPKRENIHIVRMRNTTLGKQIVRVGDHDMVIFDRERTIVDAFRYLDKEVSLKALKAYLKNGPSSDINKLMKYAKVLRVDITPYLQAYTT